MHGEAVVSDKVVLLDMAFVTELKAAACILRLVRCGLIGGRRGAGGTPQSDTVATAIYTSRMLRRLKTSFQQMRGGY